MSNTIENCLEVLTETIKNSEEYKVFEEKKNIMKEHPEYKRQIDVFRKQVYLLQNSDTSIDKLDEMGHMLKERRELHKNPLIEEYLTAELHLCRILQRLSMEILTITDMEIDSFEDVISV